MSHTITVLFEGSEVRADPNPSPVRGRSVSPGDTVTWRFSETRDLQVVFRQFVDLDGNGNPIEDTRRDSNPLGPFSNLSCGAGLIVGTIRSNVLQGVTATSRRFHYRLVENGADLNKNSVIEGDPFNGGGIDIPRTPP